MADVLDIDNAEEFEVDEEGDRKYMLDNDFMEAGLFMKDSCTATNSLLQL
jgi:hypothetical protein